MAIPDYPAWQWVYFGVLGTVGAVFFVLTLWTWFRGRRSTTGGPRSAVAWIMGGLVLLFVAAYMACGIGGFPGGNLLSSDATAHKPDWGRTAAELSILFSAPGWICMFVGMRKLLKHAEPSE